MTIAADPKHLGARIGITAVLHKQIEWYRNGRQSLPFSTDIIAVSSAVSQPDPRIDPRASARSAAARNRDFAAGIGTLLQCRAEPG